MANAATEKRWTLSFVPKNSDLTFLFFGCLYVFLVMYTGFSFSERLIKLFAKEGVTLLFSIYLLSLPVIALKVLYHAVTEGRASLRHGAVWMTLVQPYWTLEFLFVTVRRIIIILGAIYLFLHLKHLILWWHRANYDLALWDFDRALHFGVQPNIWAMETFGAYPIAEVLLDWLYINYFNYKIIVCMVFLMEPRGRKLSDQFFLAYQLTWFLGGLAYLALPSDGPCYAVLSKYSIPKEDQFHIFKYPIITDPPPSYVEKYNNAKIFHAKMFQEKLWVDRRSFLARNERPGIFYGVAAMPSLHNAAVWMMMIFLFRASVFAGVAALLYVITTFFGSIFLQWHYAVDGYVGAVLAIIVSWVSIKTPEIWPLLRRKSRRSCGDR